MNVTRGTARAPAGSRGATLAVGAVVTLATLAVAACGPGGPPELDVRTYELEHITPDKATDLVSPYVWGSRPGAPGTLSRAGGAISVRETPDNLEKIARVLEEYDVPQPQLRLHFQLIEANGNGEADPAIARVEEELRKLFRFDGYRLVDQTVGHGIEGGGVARTFVHRERPYRVEARVREIQTGEGVATLTLDPVELRSLGGPMTMRSSVRMRTGQTVVIGSTPGDLEGGALILTVRAELGDGSGG